MVEEARPGTILAIDEFPALVASGREVPSLLQKRLDEDAASRQRLVLAGSSQRMMQGLVLDRSAPLFGRAHEVLRIAPLPAGWISARSPSATRAGPWRRSRCGAGCPATGSWPRREGPSRGRSGTSCSRRWASCTTSPPLSSSTTCARSPRPTRSWPSWAPAATDLSEIAGRLGKPATSLAHPLARLLDLGLVRRDLPFGAAVRETKRSAYRLADPFLRFWFRFVEPNRSRLQAGLVEDVGREVARAFAQHAAGVFEDLVRESVPRAGYFGVRWGPAASWWGPGLDRTPLEIDVVAESIDKERLLVGEVKWSETVDWGRDIAELRRKAENLPVAHGREVRWPSGSRRAPPGGSPRSLLLHPRRGSGRPPLTLTSRGRSSTMPIAQVAVPEAVSRMRVQSGGCSKPV